jgi:hypothetical protein
MNGHGLMAVAFIFAVAAILLVQHWALQAGFNGAILRTTIALLGGIAGIVLKGGVDIMKAKRKR